LACTTPGEGDVDDGIDDEHIDGRVRGLRLVDTGNGRRRRLQADHDNDNDVEEGGSHPTTPQMTAMRELVESGEAAFHRPRLAAGRGGRG